MIFFMGLLPRIIVNSLNSDKSEINIKTNKFTLKTNNSNFLIDSNIDLGGSFANPILEGNLSLKNQNQKSSSY